MGEKNSSLTFRIKDTDAQSFKLTPIGMFSCVVMIVALPLIFCNWFPSAQLEIFAITAMAAVIFAVMIAVDRFVIEKYVPWVTIIISAAFCLVFNKNVIAGFGVLANDVLWNMSLLTGKIYLDYAVADTTKVLWAVIPLMTVVITFIYKSVSEGKFLFAALVALVVYVAVAVGLYPADIAVGLFFFGIVLCAAARTGFIRRNSEGFAGKGYYVIILVLCLVAFLGVGYFVQGDAEIPGRNKVADMFHDHFHHIATNAMPEGNLKDLGAFEKSDAPALEITMQENQKMYLRGNIYEVYDGSGWQMQDKTILGEYEDMFYSLHKTGFFGQSQISRASSVAGEITPLSMSVKNISACSSHGYYPYGVYTDDIAPEYMGDVILPAKENISYLAGSVPEWYLLQQSLAANQDEEVVNSYLAAEDVYEKYINEVDLQLTDESWSLFSDRLGENASMSLSDIRDKIRDFLENNLIYDETVTTNNGGLDFADYTLSQTGSGYSVHYATIATLMLRFYGVPARYVEGYFISEDEAVGYDNGESITLTESHAHAWTEYYLPGVGFVPFEVTPGYMDDEEDEIGTDDSIGGIMYVSDNLKYAQVKRPEQIEERKQNKMNFSLKPEYLLYILAASLLLFVAVVMKKRSMLKKAVEKIDTANNRDAISMRYGYAMALMKTVDIQAPEYSSQAKELNREAIFSLHEMSDEQRKFMDEYAKDVLDICKEKWTIFQKVRYCLWDCLY